MGFTANIAATRDTAEAISYWATTCGIFLAFLGGCLAVFQYYLDRRRDRLSYAKTKYEEFINCAILNPEYCIGFWDSDLRNDPSSRGGYIYFAARMLWACEEILLTPGIDQSWRGTVLAVLRDHRAFLVSSDFLPDKPTYTRELVSLIDQVSAEYHSERPNA